MQSISRNTARVLRGVYLFRIFAVILVAIILIIYWSFVPPPEIDAEASWVDLFMLPSLVVTIFVLLPRLEQRLGARYLPIALTLSILAFSLEFIPAYLRPGVQVILELPSGRRLSQFWASTEAVLLVLIPCVLAGAAYGMRGAVRAATLATVLHFGLGLSVWLLGRPIHGFLGLLPMRVALLWGLPVVAGYLADTWQREHTALQEANRQLRGYAATVEQLATSRERVRLARDMHDTLAHTLTALVVQLDAVDALQETDPAASVMQLKKVQGQARVGLDEARRAILDLRSSPVEETGLAGALEWLANKYAAGYTLEGEPPPLPAVQANGLFRIAEEVLSNAERHAEASQVAVRLAYAKGSVTLQIWDDGEGFDPDTVNPKRVGLKGIHERAALIGAQVVVQSDPNGAEGTIVTVQLDIA